MKFNLPSHEMEKLLVVTSKGKCKQRNYKIVEPYYHLTEKKRSSFLNETSSFVFITKT